MTFSFKRECVLYAIYLVFIVIHKFTNIISTFWFCALIYLISLFYLFSVNKINCFQLVRFKTMKRLYRVKLKKTVSLCFRISVVFIVLFNLLSAVKSVQTDLSILHFSLYFFINLLLSDMLLFSAELIRRLMHMELLLVILTALSFILMQCGVIRYNLLFYPIMKFDTNIWHYMDQLLPYLFVIYFIYLLRVVKYREY